MSTLTQVSELLGHHHHDQADARLILDFEARSKSRQRVQLADGEAVALMLPRGTLLRGGDWLRDSRGRLIEVVAAPEWLSCVSGEPLQLLRAAYHLGNRHIPLQIAPGWLRYQHDSVL
ncbi:MAG: urease accessory protein UreE, partial [Pseudomonadales bacterium]|nr:urease accessory protein UreE [Pseudomonadales bacterium]